MGQSRRYDAYEPSDVHTEESFVPAAQAHVPDVAVWSHEHAAPAEEQLA